MPVVQDQLACDGFEVWATVAGIKANVFGIETVGTNRKSCWIASAAEEEFSISFRRNEFEECDYCAWVILDGRFSGGLLCQNRVDPSRTRTISSAQISLTEARKFAFGSLELTDDDTRLEDPATQNIGEIEVILRRVEMKTLSCHHKPLVRDISAAGKVHERSSKGLAHQIKFGSVAENDCTNALTASIDKYRGDKISFIFRYRPLEMLQALGIVCPTVSSPADHNPNLHSTSPTNKPIKQEAIVVKREHSDDDGDEEESDSEEDDVEEMLAKAHALLAKIESTRSKRRAKKEAARANKKIKTEPTPSPFIPGEIVDLT